jgi:hypothetical protein
MRQMKLDFQRLCIENTRSQRHLEIGFLVSIEVMHTYLL